ncbi:phage tail protein [Oceanobacillus locisalsi]|uniref:Phage tail protein n=1 Tax=Oceanobacillus locisalsi TaxID=546107 RepID=A0ABW3NJA4_9BACI
MHVIDLEGNEYALQATSTNEGELNGNQSFSCTILPTKVNKLFIEDIAQMWNVVDHDDVEHKIVYSRKKGEGKSLTVDIKAIPLFFDALDGLRDEYDLNEHLTAERAFNHIFEGTGFGFILNGTFPAVQWEGFGKGGDETKLQTFTRALNRYKAEFRIVGRTIYLENQIGRDTQFMYRYRLNASNIVQEIDAAAYYTYAKGYGDYEDSEEGGWENAKLKRIYKSPLADIPGIGIKHAPPLKDGRRTDGDALYNDLKTIVDESLKVSVSADIHDLSKQGYPVAQSELGDRVFLIDERIQLDDEVRVIFQSVTRNWKGEIININITFGTEGIAKRYQAGIQSATRNIQELLEGKIQLPYSVLDDAVKNATRLIQNANTELQFPNSGGILAVDPDNPNYLVSLTSRGLGVSSDGGATFPDAITGLGINASVVTTGSMLADRIAGGILASLNGRTVFDLNNGLLTMENTEFRLGSGAIINFRDRGNKLQFMDSNMDSTRRYSGLGVGLGVDDYPYPMTYIGTSEGGERLDALLESFTGFIAHSHKSLQEGAHNSIIGRNLLLREGTSYTRALRMNLTGNNPTLQPLNTDQHSYRLGVENNRWADVWAWNYHGNMAQTSTHAAKMGIEEVDDRKAFDHFEMMDIKSWLYQEDDYANKFNRRVGPIMEQLDPVLENLYKSSPDELDFNSNFFLLVQAVKYKWEEFNERLELLENGTETA